jgi:hypothetical protein
MVPHFNIYFAPNLELLAFASLKAGLMALKRGASGFAGDG